jgi:hypothetical protein
MGLHPHHDRPSLDNQAFALLLCSLLSSMLLWAGVSVLAEVETQATPVAIAASPSQLQCARL